MVSHHHADRHWYYLNNGKRPGEGCQSKKPGPWWGGLLTTSPPHVYTELEVQLDTMECSWWRVILLFKRVSLEASLLLQCQKVKNYTLEGSGKGAWQSQAGVTSYAFLCVTGSLLRHFSIATPFPSHAIWMPATKTISTVSQYCHGNQSQSKLTERTKPVAFKMIDTCPCFQSLLKLFVRPSTNPGTEIFSNDGASEKPELITF